jgi:hypothetical protein
VLTEKRSELVINLSGINGIGKSTYFTYLAQMLSTDRVSITDYASFFGSEMNPPKLASFINSLFVVVDEMPKECMQESSNKYRYTAERIKFISGSDHLKADKKYENLATYENRMTLILSSNYTVPLSVGGVDRRVLNQIADASRKDEALKIIRLFDINPEIKEQALLGFAWIIANEYENLPPHLVHDAKQWYQTVSASGNATIRDALLEGNLLTILQAFYETGYIPERVAKAIYKGKRAWKLMLASTANLDDLTLFGKIDEPDNPLESLTSYFNPKSKIRRKGAYEHLGVDSLSKFRGDPDHTNKVNELSKGTIYYLKIDKSELSLPFDEINTETIAQAIGAMLDVDPEEDQERIPAITDDIDKGAKEALDKADEIIKKYKRKEDI